MARHPGWSAVANPEKAEHAFKSWCTRDCTLDINALILARDYAVLHNKGKKVVDAINSDLREAVCSSLRGEQHD